MSHGGEIWGVRVEGGSTADAPGAWSSSPVRAVVVKIEEAGDTVREWAWAAAVVVVWWLVGGEGRKDVAGGGRAIFNEILAWERPRRRRFQGGRREVGERGFGANARPGAWRLYAHLWSGLSPV
jgi:hypothetical protein